MGLSRYKSQALNADVVLQGGMSGRVHTRYEILQARSQLALANESQREWEEEAQPWVESSRSNSSDPNY